jgi:predicted NBD/HSP70 family sugar kinase
MRALNTQLVLDSIRKAGTTSQADLIRTTKLNTGTIVSIVRDLRSRGFIIEAGRGVSRGGRRPTLLRLNPSAASIAACQIGSETATAAILDLNAQIVARHELPVEAGLGPEAFMSSLSACITEMCTEFCGDAASIAGIGLSLHGPVDSENGILLVSEHLGWREVPFGPSLGERLGVRVFALAETRAIALAEQRWGAAQNVRDFVLVELDTGIGMVQVLDGTICRGKHDMAGELGFTVWETGRETADNESPRVLEDVASLRALCRHARELPDTAAAADERTVNHESAEEICLRRLVAAADNGCVQAREVLDNATNALGIAIANVANLFDPELVLLTGRLVSGVDGALMNHIRDCTERHVLATQEHAPRIECAVLGTDAALRGAASLVIDRYLNAENLARL